MGGLDVAFAEFGFAFPFVAYGFLDGWEGDSVEDAGDGAEDGCVDDGDAADFDVVGDGDAGGVDGGDVVVFGEGEVGGFGAGVDEDFALWFESFEDVDDAKDAFVEDDDDVGGVDFAAEVYFFAADAGEGFDGCAASFCAEEGECLDAFVAVLVCGDGEEVGCGDCALSASSVENDFYEGF